MCVYLQEFVEKSTRLLDDPGTFTTITHNASKEISQNHTKESEAAAYVKLIHAALNNPG